MWLVDNGQHNTPSGLTVSGSIKSIKKPQLRYIIRKQRPSPALTTTEEWTLCSSLNTIIDVKAKTKIYQIHQLFLCLDRGTSKSDNRKAEYRTQKSWNQGIRLVNITETRWSISLLSTKCGRVMGIYSFYPIDKRRKKC